MATTSRRPLSLPWVRIRNDHSSTLPAFGCFKVSGVATVAGELVFTVTQPTAATDAMTARCGFAGPAPIASGKTGEGRFDFPALALYDDSDTPAVNKIWGPQNGAWTLTENNPGFITMHAGVTTSPKRVYVMPMPRGGFVAEATGTITARSGSTPGSGTVKLQYNNGGTITDLVTGLTAKSWVTTALSSGDKLFAEFDPFGELWVTNKDCT